MDTYQGSKKSHRCRSLTELSAIKDIFRWGEKLLNIDKQAKMQDSFFRTDQNVLNIFNLISPNVVQLLWPK